MKNVIRPYLSTHEINETLNKVSKRYLKSNPPEQLQFMVTNEHGFRRDGEYRYLLDLKEKLPTLVNGQYVYAWSQVTASKPGDIISIYLNPMSRTRLFVNGNIVYSSSLADENDPNAASIFNVELDKKMNSFVIECKCLPIGCGCIFGTGSVKRNPFYTMVPSKNRINEEGWLYSTPQDQKMTNLPELGSSETDTSIQWLPKLPELDGKNIVETMLERVPTYQNAVVYAKAQFKMIKSDIVRFNTTSFKSTLLSVDGNPVENGKLKLTAGTHQIILTINDSNEKINTLQLVDGQGTIIPVTSSFNLAGSSPFSFIGPIMNPSNEVVRALQDNTNIIENQYWRTRYYSLCIRPVVKSALFGRWNYPLGVTLKGLIDYGLYEQNQLILDYVQQHIEQCTSWYPYALWDRKKYGAQCIDYSVAAIDSLDDCGSFAFTMLYAMRFMPINNGEIVANDICDYILHQQPRRSDGCLYRKNGHERIMAGTMWADDIYMSVPFLIEYSKLIGNTALLDEAARQIIGFSEYLLLPNQQLLAHVYNFKMNRNTQQPWGRGNGWVFLSLVLLLKEYPKNGTYYLSLHQLLDILAQGYQKRQGEDGLWHQLLNDESSYAESSVTAMMIFSFSNLIIQFSSQTFIEIPKLINAWQQLTHRMIDEQGNLAGVCRGSGYSFDPDYYKFDLLPQLNDTHGTGIVLSAGCALIKLLEHQKNG